MEKSPNHSYNLEERLITFAVRISEVAESLPKTLVGKHLGNQLIRSGTSPALNYGEAQAAESRSDFLHKMKICLKELRETIINLKILHKKAYFKQDKLAPLINENDQLIAIFIKSINTAKGNDSSK